MNSGINCVVDTPILQELYNKVKNKVESYEEFKTLVSLWWRREKQKNPQFDYEVYPSPEEIDSLLSERTDKKEEGMGLTISYTPKGKRTQVYTIKGSHIYNRDGKEVFAKDSIDRNKIFANLAVKSGRAVVVEHNNSRYVVNDRNQIISVATGKMMQWDEKNGDRNAIIKAAQEKFSKNKPSESIQKSVSFNWGRTSDNNYEVSTIGDERFSAFNATFKKGTVIDGVDVGGMTIEDVYQKVIKKSGKGKAPSQKSRLNLNPTNTSETKRDTFKQEVINKYGKPLNYSVKEGIITLNLEKSTLELIPFAGLVKDDKGSSMGNKDINYFVGGLKIVEDLAEGYENYSYYEGYLPLWQEWAKQNPELIEELRTKAAGKTLTDQFADTRVSQARALADILNSASTESETIEEAPIFEDNETSIQDSYSLASGDAVGSDAAWTSAAREVGIKNIRNFSTKSYDALSEEEKKEADSEYLKAAAELKRPALSSTIYTGKLVRRNWLQVKNADAIFAIGHIINHLEKGRSGLNHSKHAVVDGGTGYAVQMAINNNKPVHVFDQDKGKWFTWKDGNFVEEPSPVLTKRFAGIGTRQINDSGKAAIKEIFSRTFNLQQENGAIVNNFIPFSEEIEELSLEERGLTPAINPNDLEAKADVAFGTPQRRRDRVNLIANAIRQNFSIEFERQKRALQERISSETDADKIVELQEQLDTLDEKRAVELGLNNILVRIKKMFQPKDSLPAYYNSEFVKLQDNWDTVVTEALELLKETDGLAVDFIETNFDDGTQIDEESGDYFDDDSQKEYGYKDGWMTKARFVDQRDSLSKKVRKIIWTTDKIGFDGKPEIDDLGFKRYLQPDMVQATLLQALGQSRNSEHFWKILNDLAKKKKWVQPLIDRLNKEEDTKSQFYQNFRKEFMPYWVQLQKEVKNTDGEIISVVTQTKRVNKIPGIMHMLDEWRDNYEEGSKLDELSVYKEGQQLDKDNASKAFDYISELQNSYPEDVNEWIESDGNLNKVMRVLHMAGITADAEVVREALKGEDLQDGTQRLDKIYQLLSGMFRDIKEDKVGKTVSSDGTVQYDDLLNAYDSTYTIIARIIDTIPEDSVLSSFREAGNSYQSYSAPSYLGKLINNLKNLDGTAESLNKFYQEQYGQYKWFYSKNTGYRSSWLRQLVNSQSKRDLLDRKVILHSGKLEFNDWGNSEYAKVMISEFLSTADNNSAWYYLPLLADAESAEFIKFTKYTDSSVQDESGNYIPYDKLILNELEDVVRQEYDRIMLVRQREGKVNPIANFDIIRDEDGEEIGVVRNADGDIISRNTGNEFKFFPALNTYKINGRLFIDVLQEKILRNDSDVASFIQSALSDIMESGFTKFMKTIDEAGVLETNNGVSKYFQIKASELEGTLRNFYWNNALAQTQLIELTTTDLAYYKDMRDFQKRFKEVYAQTLKLNTEATFNGEKVGRQNGRVAYLKDLKMVAPSKEALKQMLEGRVEAGAISELDKDAILNHFNKVNVADAQAYRTLDSYRRVLVMSGRWTQTDEDAMNRLKNGTWNIKDFNTIWQTIKPFMYTQGPRPSGVADYGNIKVPSQYKNSEFLLLAMYNTIATPLQDSSVLRAINEFMEENDIDIVMFESAVKAGNQAPIKIDINMSLPDIKNLLNSKIKNSDGSENAEVIHEFDYEDYGIQVETPEHMVDKYQLFGTQIRKLISSDMADDIEISLFGSKKKFSKAEWWTMYNGLITANVVDSYNEVAKEFSSIEHIAEIIQNELKGNTRYSDEIKKACELIEVTNPLTGETEKVFNLPLYDPVQSERVQHLLNSIIKKKVIKQTIKGGTGIQVSAYGLTDKLHIVWEGEGKNRRMKYMECYLPAYSKEFFEPLMKFKTVNGEQVGYLDINELPEELRRIIGYRI